MSRQRTRSSSEHEERRRERLQLELEAVRRAEALVADGPPPATCGTHDHRIEVALLIAFPDPARRAGDRPRGAPRTAGIAAQPDGRSP